MKNAGNLCRDSEEGILASKVDVSSLNPVLGYMHWETEGNIYLLNGNKVHLYSPS